MLYEGGYRLTLMEPLYKVSDMEYVASDEAIGRQATGLGLYHFHFQRITVTWGRGWGFAVCAGDAARAW